MTRPLAIAVAGLGTVGAGVVKLLRANADIIAARAGRPIAITAVSTQRAAPWLAPGQREQLVRERGFE